MAIVFALQVRLVNFTQQHHKPGGPDEWPARFSARSLSHHKRYFSSRAHHASHLSSSLPGPNAYSAPYIHFICQL